MAEPLPNSGVTPDAPPSSSAGRAQRPADVVTFWKFELARYEKEFKEWNERCDKITRRYRDERPDTESARRKARLSVLWSNIQTLQPAVYIKAPKPIAERRFLDKDVLGRFASMTLERACEVMVEVGGFHPTMQKCVLDYLLYARGVMWNRYEPTYGEVEGGDDEAPTDDVVEATANGTGGKDAPSAQSQNGNSYSSSDSSDRPSALRAVTYERVCSEYVDRKDFRHSPERVWELVWWVAKREWMTRAEMRERWPDERTADGKLIADVIPLVKPDKDDPSAQHRSPKAPIWEIWDKRKREIIFIAEDYREAPIDVADDPLHLQEFWPCQKPIYGTLTNNTLVPVPDYAEYQDQAQEIDDYTGRIKALTSAVKAAGVYDASVPELKRLLSEGIENKLIGVSNWSELTSKGGVTKSIEFLPLKDIVEALVALYDARERAKSDLAETTGLSDIVRGQAQAGAPKTATEQRIKGQFATLRLQDRQAEVARFARDGIRITAEIIAEQFSPEVLAQMTGIMQYIAEELASTPPPSGAQAGGVPGQMPGQPGQPGMGHNGGPPMGDQIGMGNIPPQAAEQMLNAAQAGQPVTAETRGTGLSPQALMAALQQAGNGAPGMPPMGGPPIMLPPQPPPPPTPEMVFQAAIELLRSDKMRTFRIDIETDSTIEVDAQSDKEAAVELLQATAGFLQQAIPAGQQLPALVPMFGQMLLFGFRRFRVGRDLEGAIQQAIDQLTTAAKNPGPKQPSPEEIKAQAEMQKQQMEGQRMQAEARMQQQQQAMTMEGERAKFELEREKMGLEMEIAREKHAMEMAKMNAQLQLQARSAEIDAQAQEHSAALQAETQERDAQVQREMGERALETDKRKHELGMEALTAQTEAKVKAAKAAPKPAAKK